MTRTLRDRLTMIPSAVAVGLVGAALTLIVSDHIVDAIEPNAPVPQIITVYEDGSYSLPDGTTGCIPEQLCDNDRNGGTR